MVEKIVEALKAASDAALFVVGHLAGTRARTDAQRKRIQADGGYTWAATWDQIRLKDTHELYPLALAFLAVTLFVWSVGSAIAHESAPPTFLIMCLAGAGVLGLLTPHIHEPGGLGDAEVLLVAAAATLFLWSCSEELGRQIHDLDRVPEAPVEMKLALGVPIGIGLLGIPLGIVALRGRTTGYTRLTTVPAWLSLIVGFVATYTMTDRPGNLALALVCSVALVAVIARARH